MNYYEYSINNTSSVIDNAIKEYLEKNHYRYYEKNGKIIFGGRLCDIEEKLMSISIYDPSQIIKLSFSDEKNEHQTMFAIQAGKELESIIKTIDKIKCSDSDDNLYYESTSSVFTKNEEVIGNSKIDYLIKSSWIDSSLLYIEVLDKELEFPSDKKLELLDSSVFEMENMDFENNIDFKYETEVTEFRKECLEKIKKDKIEKSLSTEEYITDCERLFELDSNSDSFWHCFRLNEDYKLLDHYIEKQTENGNEIIHKRIMPFDAEMKQDFLEKTILNLASNATITQLSEYGSEKEYGLRIFTEENKNISLRSFPQNYIEDMINTVVQLQAQKFDTDYYDAYINIIRREIENEKISIARHSQIFPDRREANEKALAETIRKQQERIAALEEQREASFSTGSMK